MDWIDDLYDIDWYSAIYYFSYDIATLRAIFYFERFKLWLLSMSMEEIISHCPEEVAGNHQAIIA